MYFPIRTIAKSLAVTSFGSGMVLPFLIPWNWIMVSGLIGLGYAIFALIDHVEECEHENPDHC